MTENHFQRILQDIAEGLRAKHVKAILMGGGALPIYGVERMTFDLDFLLDEKALPVFAKVVSGMSKS